MSEADADRRELVAALRQVADPVALLEGIFANTPVALQIYDVSGHCILTNRAFLAMFGSTPPPDYNVLTDDIAARTGLSGFIQRAFGGETVTLPKVWYDPRELQTVVVNEGNRVAIETTFFPVFDGGEVTHVAAVFKDLTAETQAREAVETERDLLRLVIEQSGDGIVVADRRGVIEVFNPAASRLHGLDRQGVPPDKWSEVYGLFTEHGTPLPLKETPLYRAMRGETVADAAWIVRRPDGSERKLCGTATPLHQPDGTSAGAVLVCRDETERAQRDEERAALLGSEQHARAEAERANRAKDDFLAMLGHELRNPLAPIQTALDLIALRGEPETRELSVMRRQVEHLARLVDDLLDVSRIAQGKVELRRGIVDLAHVIERAVEMASPLFAANAQHVAVDVAPGLYVDGDADRLAQVVSNLLTNAARYTPRAGHIQVRATRENMSVAIEVIDDGIGMAPDLLETVFDLFVQGRKQASGGLGLGLTLVKRLVELHGGTAVALSEGEGRGSTLRVTFPALPAAHANAMAPPPGEAPAVNSKRVLVVDDNVDAAELLAEALRASGHDVAIAHDAPTALAAIERALPVVAILDLGLPVMDGYELAQAIRQRFGDRITLIAISGYGREQDRARSAVSGFRAHLVKPANMTDVLRAIGDDP